MESQMKKYSRQVSPERAKVWTEKSPKYHQNRKVPVIYYLSRNRQLEHPHFMEVHLSSPEGLYLRDVIDRLNNLRGRGMTSMYSWSCKRSYKSGFVWHDLCEDDLILPAHGNEYVLKGSELFDESNSDRFSPINNVKLHGMKQLPEPATSRSQDEASSSSSMNWKDTRHSQEQEQEDELSQGQLSGNSSDVSPESRAGGKSTDPLSLTLTEYKICNNNGLGLAADASTQTDQEHSSTPKKTQETCTRGVSTEDNGSTLLEMCRTRDNVSSHPSSVSSSKTETLESLIRADSDTSTKMDSFRILKEEDNNYNYIPNSNTRLKASTLLMQLISCGSISVKSHSFDLIPPSYNKARFCSHPKFSTSIMLGSELDCLTENSRLLGLRLDDKECFSGSLVETTKLLKEHHGGHTALRRSSSCSTAERRYCREENSELEEKKESSTGHSKCIPRTITKQPRIESITKTITTQPLSSPKTQPPTNDIDTEDLKIEERLASGARVIIQSKPSACGAS